MTKQTKKKTNKKTNTTTKVNKKVKEIKIKKEIIEPKEPKKETTEKNNLTIVYFLTILYLELIFKIFTFSLANLFNTTTIYILVFTLIESFILTILTRIFSKKINKKIFYSIIFFLSTWYFANFVFKRIFNTFFSITLFSISDQAFAFAGSAIIEILKYFLFIILFFLPVILSINVTKNLNLNPNKNKKLWYYYFISTLLSMTLFLTLVNLNEERKELYYNVDNHALTIEKMGVNTATYLEFKRIFFKVKEKVELENNEIINNETITDEQVKESIIYNNLDIDFDNLISTTKDKNIKEMHEYFKNDIGTNKNAYTNLFKDKNLIIFMAESLNTIAISEKYTPTLYKLTHEGYEFENFYTPINLSTLGGEFQNLTSLFADISTLSKEWRKGKNYYPFGLGNVFTNIGYKNYAYHANTASFQNRDNYLKNIGFTNYKAKGTGLEKLMNCNTWPQSDYDMVNATYEDYINEDKFITYYVSVSGHMPWSWSGNNISRKNKNLLEGSNYSEEAAAYIAANIELDKALELLIQKLEEKEILDDTVIAVIPDHYPYSMNIKTINELSDYERDTKFEVNHSSLIIYNPTIEHQIINKITTQLDVIPTLYNLFGIEYDSRLLMGKDIFSNSEGIAYFSDRSWITNLGRYDASTKKFIKANESINITDDYINNINKIVNNRISMSKLIMQKNYYKIVLGSE